VIQNLENRELSEQARLDAEVCNEDIKKTLDKVVGVDSGRVREELTAMSVKPIEEKIG